MIGLWGNLQAAFCTRAEQSGFSGGYKAGWQLGVLCPIDVTTYITPRCFAQLDDNHSRLGPGQVLLRCVVRQAGAGGAAVCNRAKDARFPTKFRARRSLCSPARL